MKHRSVQERYVSLTGDIGYPRDPILDTGHIYCLPAQLDIERSTGHNAPFIYRHSTLHVDSTVSLPYAQVQIANLTNRNRRGE